MTARGREDGTLRDEARPITRAAIVSAARAYLGTPYLHQASARGIGCDCLGLVRAVYRDVGLVEPAEIPAYTPDIGDATGVSHLIEIGAAYLAPTAGVPATGDVLLLRWHRRTVPKHLGILTAPGWIIHAIENRGVVEVPLAADWHRRIVRTYAFPGLTD